jgi:ORMDL family
VTQEVSWTLTNISYMFGSYLMFHYVRGVPFEFNAGAYDNLNMWEQMDNGDQYTPAKKFLLSVPVMLFLLSTHYTHYDLTYFTINFLALMAVVIPKLPWVGLPISPCKGGSNRLTVAQTESSHAGRTLFRRPGRSLKFIHSFCLSISTTKLSTRIGIWRIWHSSLSLSLFPPPTHKPPVSPSPAIIKQSL